jgi:hypothetical protein
MEMRQESGQYAQAVDTIQDRISGDTVINKSIRTLCGCERGPCK